MRNEIEELLFKNLLKVEGVILEDLYDAKEESLDVHNAIIDAVEEYAKPFINSLEEANKLTSYWINEANKKDAEIIQLRYDLSLLTKRVW